jgi:hypothetical protein
MSKIRRSLLFLFILAFISQTHAQDKRSSEVIETAVAKLQQKVLLSDKQTADVTTLLNRNAEGLRNSSTRDKTVNDAKLKVEGMLDARQKAKYSIIKNDWWNTLARDLSQN